MNVLTRQKARCSYGHRLPGSLADQDVSPLYTHLPANLCKMMSKASAEQVFEEMGGPRLVPGGRPENSTTRNRK